MSLAVQSPQGVVEEFWLVEFDCRTFHEELENFQTPCYIRAPYSFQYGCLTPPVRRDYVNVVALEQNLDLFQRTIPACIM